MFADIYRRGGWVGSRPTVSGSGSVLEQTAALREELPGLLSELGAQSLLDAACGDLHWMKECELPVARYIGVDIVPDLIARNSREFPSERFSFIVADLADDPLPEVDVILCRDCLVHLTLGEVTAVLSNFRRSGSRYLLTTTFPGHDRNEDLDQAGGWRPLNLTLAPFGFPAPLRLIDEGCTEGDGRYADKSLGLWRLADLKV